MSNRIQQEHQLFSLTFRFTSLGLVKLMKLRQERASIQCLFSSLYLVAFNAWLILQIQKQNLEGPFGIGWWTLSLLSTISSKDLHFKEILSHYLGTLPHLYLGSEEWTKSGHQYNECRRSKRKTHLGLLPLIISSVTLLLCVCVTKTRNSLSSLLVVFCWKIWEWASFVIAIPYLSINVKALHITGSNHVLFVPKRRKNND